MMSDQSVHEGGCLCGAVRYQVTGQPARTAVCHCRYCQLRTGSAFGLSTYFPSSHVKLLSGDLRDHTLDTESGRKFTTRFCKNCGTSVLWNLEMSPDLTGIAGGTFDPPTFWFNVTREIFTRSAAPFIHTDCTERHETTASYAPIKKDSPALGGGRNG
jgi:hypothetical protein